MANKMYYEFWCREVLAEIRPKQESGVFLELMCGTGELMARYQTVPEVRKFGIDLTMRLLAYGMAHHGDIGQFVCADARRLPLADHSVDVIAIQGGLHHVANDLDTVISEIGRVLVPGGVLVCTEPCNDNPLVRGMRRIAYKLFKIFDPSTERGLYRQELRNAMANANLSLEVFRPFGYLGFALIANTDVLGVFHNLRWWLAIRFLIWTDETLARLPAVRHLAWLCIFRARKLGPTVFPAASTPVS